jgi:hypothetical protein
MKIEPEKYDFEMGDLVHLREWHDDVGWVTLKDMIFMVVASQIEDTTGEPQRNIVRVVGSGHNIETYAGYFVKVPGLD